jgi:choline dehydrogenase
MNRQGVRKLASDGLDLRKLTLFTNFLVDRIAWSGHRAEGVWGWPKYETAENMLEASPQLIMANKGVILSAGAFLSPAILWRSGIGPRHALQRLGLPVVYENDAVGENLQDHLAVPFVFPVRSAFTAPPFEWISDSWSPRDLARWQTTGGGPVASNLAECGILSARQMETDRENAFQLHCTPTDYLRYPRPGGEPTLSITVNGSWPKSRGRVWLDTTRPGAPPKIDPNFLQTNDDWLAIWSGVEAVVRIVDTPEMRKMLSENRTLKGCEVDDARLARHVERFALTLYHPCGTCIISADDSGVVNQKLNVNGTDNVWVVDASILPRIPGCNPNPLVMGVANRWASQWLG